jgi:hypothetical protein
MPDCMIADNSPPRAVGNARNKDPALLVGAGEVIELRAA